MDTLQTLLEKVESYEFECEGGPLTGCVQWQELRALMALRAAPEHDTPAGVDEQCKAYSANLGGSPPEQGWHCPDCGDVSDTSACQKQHIPAFAIPAGATAQPAHGEREPLKVSALIRARESGIAEGLERAAKFISREIESLVESNAYVEHDTNATVFTNEHAEALVNALDEILESVQALAPAKQPDAEGGQFVVVPRKLSPAMNVAMGRHFRIAFYEDELQQAWDEILAALPAVLEKKS